MKKIIIAKINKMKIHPNVIRLNFIQQIHDTRCDLGPFWMLI